jgi:hypothetical protein
MQEYLLTNDSNDDRLQISAEDETAARHWVINHLDLSRNWTITPVTDPRQAAEVGDLADGLIELYGYRLDDLTSNGTLDRDKVEAVRASLTPEQQARLTEYATRGVSWPPGSAGASELRVVVVEVSGGVAHVTRRPPGVQVHIIDHDNEEDGEAMNLGEGGTRG